MTQTEPVSYVTRIGAGGESRTLVTSLENLDINRYTTPA